MALDLMLCCVLFIMAPSMFFVAHRPKKQLNSDVFTGTVGVNWSQMLEEYTQYKKVKGEMQATLYKTALTLSHFERIIGKLVSRQVTQNAIDKLILDRGKEVKRSTLNKDIRNLKAFVNWCRQNRLYVNARPTKIR